MRCAPAIQRAPLMSTAKLSAAIPGSEHQHGAEEQVEPPACVDGVGKHKGVVGLPLEDGDFAEHAVCDVQGVVGLA